MAKKMKKPKPRKKVVAKKKRQHWCQMVIRVRVPIKDVPEMRVHRVTGLKSNRLYDLEISNAYYDYAKLHSPNAMPDLQ